MKQVNLQLFGAFSDLDASREIAVAPAPDATAAQIASLDGNSSATARSSAARPSPGSAASNMARVPEPGSRRTQAPSDSSRAEGALSAQG